MRPLAERWLRQAEADLAAARDSLAGGHCEWACFQAQQSAEKALKALLYSEGFTSILSHSIVDLLSEGLRFLPLLADLAGEGKALDAVYLPTRYPNALASSLAPSEYYDEEDARRCLSCAESILTACRRYIRPSTG